MANSKHFSNKELCCKCGCGLNNVSEDLLDAMEDLRRRYGRPIKVTSATRCYNHNKAVDGSENSAHLTGEAIDIAIPTATDRYTLLQIMLRLGLFKGIGIAHNFMHLDIKKRQHGCPVIFTY